MKRLSTIQLATGLFAIGFQSCAGHSEIEIPNAHSDEQDSIPTNHRGADESAGGICFDLGDTVMEEDIDTLMFQAKDWDEVDMNTDI